MPLVRTCLGWSARFCRKCGIVSLLAVRVAAQDGVPSDKIEGHLEAGPWTYSRSIIDSEGFAAVRKGSVISLIREPATLITNPRSCQENDKFFATNRILLPPVGV